MDRIIRYASATDPALNQTILSVEVSRPGLWNPFLTAGVSALAQLGIVTRVPNPVTDASRRPRLRSLRSYPAYALVGG